MSQTYTKLTGTGGLFPAIADAIRGKTGGTEQIKADDFPTEITNIPTGGGGGHVIPSDLPNDGKTRICYVIPEGSTGGMLTIKLVYHHDSGLGSTTVDWGDNSEATVSTGLNKIELTHTFEEAGEYIVSITASDIVWYFGGSATEHIYGGNTTKYTGYYIKWIVLGSGMEKIAISGLSELINLQEIKMPATGITELKNGCLSNAKALTEIEIPSSVTTIEGNVFSGCGFRSLTIPQTVTSLEGTNTINSCGQLEEITIPTAITTLGEAFFTGCAKLQEINLPQGLTAIPTSCFSSCGNLRTITIPAAVTTIGNYAFSGCVLLHKIKFLPTTPPTISNSNAFSNLPAGCVISVPTGSLSAYTSAQNYPSSSTYTYIEE